MNIKNSTLNFEEVKPTTYVCTAVPFELGSVVMTMHVANFFADDQTVLIPLLLRHQHGDWGEMCTEDKITNDEVTKTGQRVMSSFEVKGEKIWIITECDRSCTTILFPSDY